MRKLFLTASALAVMTSGVVAADLPSPPPAPVAPVVTPVFSWTGFYAGVNAGYSWGEAPGLPTFTIAGVPYALPLGVLTRSDNGSFTGGAQAGYNYQTGQFVFGAEADINYANVKREVGNALSAGTASLILGARSTVEWFGTVRARIGFTPTERLMVFAAGGLAYGGVKGSVGLNAYNYGFWIAGLNASKTDTRVGWTLGAGLEYAVTDNITARAEYAYVDLGAKTRSAYGYDILTAPYAVNWRDHARFHVVRAGLNYRF